MTCGSSTHTQACPHGYKIDDRHEIGSAIARNRHEMLRREVLREVLMCDPGRQSHCVELRETFMHGRQIFARQACIRRVVLRWFAVVDLASCSQWRTEECWWSQVIFTTRRWLEVGVCHTSMARGRPPCLHGGEALDDLFDLKRPSRNAGAQTCHVLQMQTWTWRAWVKEVYGDNFLGRGVQFRFAGVVSSFVATLTQVLLGFSCFDTHARL